MSGNISPFKTEDLEEVYSIEKTVYPKPWTKSSFLQLAKDDHFWLVSAKCGGRVVGYYVAQVVNEEGELHNIAVHPDYQGKGWGKKLLNHFLEKASKCGVKEAFLLVRPSNRWAVRLYRHFQFKHLETRKKYYTSPTEPAYVYYKKLDT